MPMTISLTSTMPSRDTWTHGPPSRDGDAKLAAGLITRAWRTLAVVQPAMIGDDASLVRHDAGTSIAIVVTFLFATVFLLWSAAPVRSAWPPVGVTPSADTPMLTRSKIWPRLTAKPSWRWPTNTRECVPAATPVGVQPGMSNW